MSDQEVNRVSNGELALVTSLLTTQTSMLTAHMDASVKQITDRFDRFENEIRPKIDAHETDITAIRTERDVEARWRRWSPPISAASITAVFSFVKWAVSWVKGHP